MKFWDPLVEDIYVKVNEPFELEFQQQPILYLSWEPEIPESIEVTDKKITLKDLTDHAVITFVCHQAGEYTMNFYYRKQCCDRRLISTRTYNVHVAEE